VGNLKLTLESMGYQDVLNFLGTGKFNILDLEKGDFPVKRTVNFIYNPNYRYLASFVPSFTASWSDLAYKQVAIITDEQRRLFYAREFVLCEMRSAISVAPPTKNDICKFLPYVQTAEDIKELMGLEGAFMVKFYIWLFSNVESWSVVGDRVRGLLADPVNITINLFHGLLYKVVTTALVGVGLDPRLGFLHTGSSRSPVPLSYDVADMFKPEVDNLARILLISGYIDETAFIQEGFLWKLTSKGKSRLMAAFSSYLNTGSIGRLEIKSKVPLWNRIVAAAQALRDAIENDLPYFRTGGEERCL